MPVELHRYFVADRDVRPAVDRWLTYRSWIADTDESTVDKLGVWQRWRDPRSAAVVGLMVLASQPFVVSMGWEPGGCVPCRRCSRQARRVARVLAGVDARLAEHGVYGQNATRFAAALDSALRQARERADNQRRVRAIEATLRHRSCPNCRAWSVRQAPWCRLCDHRFTEADDRRRGEREQAAARQCLRLLGGRPEVMS